MDKTNTLPIPADMDKTQAAVIRDAFIPFLDKADEWIKQAKSINITSVDQVEDIKKARVGRLFLKNVRVEMGKKHKEVKADALRITQTIDACHRIGRNLIEGAEAHLQKQEDFVKNEEAKIKAQLLEDRVKELAAFDVEPLGFNLGEMPEETYQKLLENSRIAYETKKEAERKAEEERIEAERKEQERIKKQAEENARLKAEAEAREKALADERAKVEKARLAAEEKARKEREAIEKKAEAERKESARLLKIEQDKAIKLRKERERIEAEAKAKQEAIEQAERDRLKAIEDEKKRKEAEEKKAARAPDKDKLTLLADRFEAPKLPEVSSKEAKEIKAYIQAELKALAANVRLKLEIL